jgi:hypothetical protein
LEIEYIKDSKIDIDLLKEDLKDISKFRAKGYSLLVNTDNIQSVSIDANDLEYSPDFLKFIEKHKTIAGVYFLYNDLKEIIYVGQSIQLGKRIFEHIGINIHFISAIQTQSKVDRFIYEPYFILKYRPLKNTQYNETGEISVKLDEPPIPEPIKVFRPKEISLLTRIKEVPNLFRNQN